MTGILLSLLAVAYLVLVIWSWREIKVAVTVIDAAADMLRNTKRLMLVNTGFFFAGVLFLFLWVGAFLGLLSMGDITPNPSVPQGKRITYPPELINSSTYGFYVFCMILGFIWI